jgi:hypothetical protein
MKTTILSLTMLSILSFTNVFAQDRTTVTATNNEISDNLDLRAVASIFGDSENLADFERRLNDPKIQISNLDLNGDNKVDYLRVIETVEGNVHLIVIQSVLGRDTFQDIATVEVERDRHNQIQVQVVGDVYMYGDNYIYEPVYAYTPVIYTSFWVSHYRPYYSSWYWGFYPSFYVAWTPFPIYTYQNHINVCINNYHHYNYVNYRRCGVVYNNYYYYGRRGNAYEREYPNRSFEHRNNGYTNRYELDNNRRTQNANTRSDVAYNDTRTTSSPRNIRTQNGSRIETSESTPRSYGNVRSQESPRSVSNQYGTRNERAESTPRSYGNVRSQESPRSISNQYGTRNERAESPPRSYGNVRSQESPRSSSPREFSQQRGNSQRSEGNSRGNRRS